MICSVWDAHHQRYEYYELPDGKIRIEGPERGKRFKAFTDFALHAEGSANHVGSGEEPKGVLVSSVEDYYDPFGWDEFIAAYAGVSLARWAMKRDERSGFGWEELGAGIGVVTLWRWLNRKLHDNR